MSAGVFISERGVSELRSAFDGRNLGFVDTSHNSIFERTASFDDFYLSLYRLHLSKTQTSSVDLQNENDLVPALRLEIVSSLEIASASGETDFGKTLIDEFVVADVLNFRNAVMSSVPLPTKLEKFSLGCVYMRFAIFASPEAKVENVSLPGITSQLLSASEHWTNLFRRYKVQDFQLRL